MYDHDAGLVNKLVGKLTKNKTLLNMLSTIPAEVLNEGLEEVAADILEPLAEWAISGNRPEYEADQLIEDGAVGVLLGLFGQGGAAVGKLARNGRAANSSAGAAQTNKAGRH